MPGPRVPALSEENRAMWRESIPPAMWQQMALYGMGQTDQFPDWRGQVNPASARETDLLEALLLGFQGELDEKRKKKKPAAVSGSTYDPILNEARGLTGR